MQVMAVAAKDIPGPRDVHYEIIKEVEFFTGARHWNRDVFKDVVETMNLNGLDFKNSTVMLDLFRNKGNCTKGTFSDPAAMASYVVKKFKERALTWAEIFLSITTGSYSVLAELIAKMRRGRCFFNIVSVGCGPVCALTGILYVLGQIRQAALDSGVKRISRVMRIRFCPFDNEMGWEPYVKVITAVLKRECLEWGLELEIERLREADVTESLACACNSKYTFKRCRCVNSQLLRFTKEAHLVLLPHVTSEVRNRNSHGWQAFVTQMTGVMRKGAIFVYSDPRSPSTWKLKEWFEKEWKDCVVFRALEKSWPDIRLRSHPKTMAIGIRIGSPEQLEAAISTSVRYGTSKFREKGDWSVNVHDWEETIMAVLQYLYKAEQVPDFNGWVINTQPIEFSWRLWTLIQEIRGEKVKTELREWLRGIKIEIEPPMGSDWCKHLQ